MYECTKCTVCFYTSRKYFFYPLSLPVRKKYLYILTKSDRTFRTFVHISPTLLINQCFQKLTTVYGSKMHRTFPYIKCTVSYTSEWEILTGHCHIVSVILRLCCVARELDLGACDVAVPE